MNHELFWPAVGTLLFVAFTAYMIGRWRGEAIQTKQTAEVLGGESIRERYYELLYAVGTVHPNETRHQTALRYILTAEASKGQGPVQNT